MQTKGLNRNTIDKYYTKDSIVELCLKLVETHLQINNNDLIIEPSAGNGSFIKGIQTLTNKETINGLLTCFGKSEYRILCKKTTYILKEKSVLSISLNKDVTQDDSI